jgi:outer membrane lipoprotein-sorting protein
MKKICLIMFFIFINILSIASGKTLSDIKSFQFDAREVTSINGKNRVKDYNVKAILPDLIKKEIVFPEENKGEIYIYNKNKKIVYLPLFEQSYEEELDDEENYIIKVIKDIKTKEQKDSKFKRDFYSGKVKEIEYESGLRIVFEKLEEVRGYYFPVQITVYDGDSKISEIMLKKIIINPEFKSSEFKI